MERYFSPDIRLVMCRSCGAPTEPPAGGGSCTCAHCHTSFEVLLRPHGTVRFPDPIWRPGMSAEEHEVERQSLLSYQVGEYDGRHNPYAFAEAPPQYQALYDLDHRAPDTPARFERALLEAVDILVRGRGRMTEQRAVCWLSRRLANLWVLRDQPAKTRAALETGLEVLIDPGFRQLVYCQLASLARRTGDLDAAEQWLALCDTDTCIIDLDSSYRSSLAMLALTRGNFDEVISTVADDDLEVEGVPWAESDEPVAMCMLIAACEHKGMADKAEELLTELLDRIDDPSFFRDMFSNSPAWAPNRAVWARLDARGGE